MIEHPIEPVFDQNSRILILGSFPSGKSREVKFFYDAQVNDLHINKVYAAFNTVCYILNAIKKHYF